jgi:hypothetical protein
VANTGLKVANLGVVTSMTTADFSVISTANGAVRRVPGANSFVMKNLTPANSISAAYAGQMWFDNNYLYVAVADNNIKRISLVSF